MGWAVAGGFAGWRGVGVAVPDAANIGHARIRNTVGLEGLTRVGRASRHRALGQPKGYLMGWSSVRRQTTHAAPPSFRMGLGRLPIVTPQDGIFPMPAGYVC